MKMIVRTDLPRPWYHVMRVLAFLAGILAGVLTGNVFIGIAVMLVLLLAVSLFWLWPQAQDTWRRTR